MFPYSDSSKAVLFSCIHPSLMLLLSQMTGSFLTVIPASFRKAAVIRQSLKKEDRASMLLRSIDTAHLLISLVITLLSFSIWTASRKIYQRTVRTASFKGERATLIRVSMDAFRFALLAGTILLILQVNGVNVSSAVAGLGILSAVVGLALQDILKDMIMGIHVMTDHFFSVGDVVRYQDIEGVVTGFTTRTTTIRSIYDQTITTICNRNISQITRMPASTLVDIDVPLSYEVDPQRVHSVLRVICARIDRLEGIDRCIYKGTQSFESSAILYKVRFFCPPETKPDRTRDALREIQNGLAEADLQIPYNQYDLHIVSQADPSRFVSSAVHTKSQAN